MALNSLVFTGSSARVTVGLPDRLDPLGVVDERLLHTVLESGLQPESIGDVVTRAGERAGIEIRFTGHSPRRGLATSSRLKGHDQIVIAKQGGWAPHSKVLAGYLEQPVPACAGRSTAASRSSRTGIRRTPCSTTARTAP